MARTTTPSPSPSPLASQTRRFPNHHHNIKSISFYLTTCFLFKRPFPSSPVCIQREAHPMLSIWPGTPLPVHRRHGHIWRPPLKLHEFHKTESNQQGRST
ncbi:hypothetical protein PVAP13_3KG000500 [Panicum virgatum]|uniref:Uncharacterized protein n=1 Tax=Panicum virgatum TaxID=38727 RepID=A0A8T0UKY4_PANVG|nr:hypothetical protein PVAP13_3KG000500 [Panicum virgatum]